MSLFRMVVLGGILVFCSPVFAADTMHVMLQEWRILTDKKELKAGPISFDVQNRGRETHEIVLLRTELSPEQLPLLAQGGINEASAGELIDEIEDLRVRSRKTLNTVLKPGNYVLLCNMVEMEDQQLEQHYAMGMRTAFVVR